MRIMQWCLDTKLVYSNDQSLHVGIVYKPLCQGQQTQYVTFQSWHQHTICWQWKLCSTLNGWITISHQKDEKYRSSWPWQHPTFIFQVTWSFGPPGITIHIQFIFFTCSLPKYLVATIMPLLKAGKSPTEITSFCPISLMSCVIKLLEHILADCLYYITEMNNLFS